MLSLYEILKASKTGIAPDMWTAFAGANFGGAGSGAETKEITGIPPLSIRSNGTMLLDYLISGNMEQTGTPTPTTPIQPQETGERTGNLYPLDASKLHVGRIENDGTIDYEVGTITVGTDSITYEANATWRGFYTDFMPVNENEKLTFSPNDSATMAWSCNCYDENGNFLGKAPAQSVAFIKTFTLLTGTKKVRISVTSSDTTYTISQPMLNTGSTALPYEPYGYKIPISSANTTTPVYLGEVETTRKVKKLVLDGTERVAYNTKNDIREAYVVTIPTAGGTTTPDNVICTHFKTLNSVDKTLTEGGICMRSTGVDVVVGGSYTDIGITAPTDSTTIVNAVKSYLAAQYAAGTPVTVWYVLATPETGIVNEPLRKIGDYADTVSYEQAGVSVPTLHGNTVIDVETELKPSEMYIKYQE